MNTPRIIYKIFCSKRECALSNEITRLKKRVNELAEAVGDPKHVVATILKKDLKWYDYRNNSKSEQKAYVAHAKSVLRNPAFRNEIRHACADLVNSIAKTTKSFDEVMEQRMTLNGIKLLVDRFNEIEMEKEPTKENLHSPI